MKQHLVRWHEVNARELVTQHAQARQAQHPAIPDDLGRTQSFTRCAAKYCSLACIKLVDSRGNRLNDHRGQAEHIGLALIPGCPIDSPSNDSTPGKQRGFDISGSHCTRLHMQEAISLFNAARVAGNEHALGKKTLPRHGSQHSRRESGKAPGRARGDERRDGRRAAGHALAASEVRHLGAKVLPFRLDVSKADQVEALATATLKQFGAPHLVFNNAGVGAGGCWENTTKD